MKHIKIQKIVIRDDMEVDDEQARRNLKELLARILQIDPKNVQMTYEDRSHEFPKQVIDKYHEKE